MLACLFLIPYKMFNKCTEYKNCKNSWTCLQKNIIIKLSYGICFQNYEIWKGMWICLNNTCYYRV